MHGIFAALAMEKTFVIAVKTAIQTAGPVPYPDTGTSSDFIAPDFA